MGEVKIKSGNLIDNWEYGDIDTNGNPVDTTDLMRTGYIPIEVDKIYSISREITTGYWKVRIYDINKTYIGSGIGNIDLLWNIGELTPGNPMQNGTSFTKIKPIAGNGYFMRFVCNGVNFSENAMMVEGDYIPSTIPEYQPYFLNRPAHKFTNGQWVDIPTHHYVNGRWQGELTSQSPLRFRADGEMLDWRIEGKTSGNLFDIGKNVNDYERAYQMISVDGSLISMKLEGSGMTFHYRTHNITTTGTVTIYCKGSKAKPKLLVRLRSMDDTKWLTNSDVTISGMAYNSVYNGWSSYAMDDTFIKTIIIPECLYWHMGVGFDSAAGTIGEIVTISNPMVISGTYTASTLPPYEPYGGVGDWDETTQRYKIPVRVEGENLFNSETSTSAYLDVRGVEHLSEKSLTSDYISVNANTGYTLGQTGDIDNTNANAYCFYNSNKEFISSGTYTPSAKGNIIRLLIPNDCAYFRFTYNHLRELVEFVEGSYTTLPPYSTTTNLYADHQLMDGDSIDFTTTETTIPLATGNNTLTVDAAVQPKSVFVKFEG